MANWRTPRPILGLFLLMMIVAGCDSTTEDDTSPSLLRLVLEPTEGLGKDSGSMDFEIPFSGFMGGDTLHLIHGTTYAVQLRLIDDSGIDVTQTFADDVEDFQVFTETAPSSGLDITVTDRESDYGINEFGDDLAVGLAFNLFTENGAFGSESLMDVDLVQFRSETKTGTSRNGADETSSFIIPVNIGLAQGPAPLQVPITDAILDVEPAPGQVDTLRKQIVVNNPAGLENGVSASDSLLLAAGVDYFFVLSLTNEANSIDFFDQVWSDSNYYEIQYDIFLPESPFARLTLAPTDANGRPVGLIGTFRLNPGVRSNGQGDITVRQYDPNRGEVKGGTTDGRVVATFSVPFRYE